MALEPDLLRRRLVAAREFRGVSQAALNAAGVDYGLGKAEAGRVERGAIEWRQKHTDAFTRILRLPTRWFTEPDDDVVIGLRPPAEALTPELAAAALEQLAATVAQSRAQDAPGTQTGQAGTGRPAAGPAGRAG